MTDMLPQDPDWPKEETTGGEMSLVDHLQELRRRLIICIIVMLVTSSACYSYSGQLIHVLTAPVGKMYFMQPAEAFLAFLKVSVFAGFLLALPVIGYQAWAFTVPALTKQERKASLILGPASLIMFFIGLTFSYYLVLPAAIRFFLGYGSFELQPLISLGLYVSFVLSFLLPFGFVFELPLIILVIAKLGLISSQLLVAKRKVVFLLAFVVGALIAPSPDILSQTLVAVPLLVLYEISILVVKYGLRK